MPINIPFINANTCYQFTPFFDKDNLTKIDTPKNWRSQLEWLCGISQTSLRHHISSNTSGYKERIKLLKYFYAILKDQIPFASPNLLDDIKASIKTKIQEGVNNCTQGFHNRCNEILELIFVPQSIEALLQRVRQGIVQKTAYKLYPTSGYTYENSENVHYTQAVFYTAKWLGFGVEMVNKRNRYFRNFYNNCVAPIEHAFSKCFTPIGIHYQILLEIKTIMSTSFAYQSERKTDESPYSEDEVKNFTVYLNTLFGEKDDVHFYFKLNNKGRVIALNWATITMQLWQKMMEAQFFDFNKNQKTAFAALYNSDTDTISDEQAESIIAVIKSSSVNNRHGFTLFIQLLDTLAPFSDEKKISLIQTILNETKKDKTKITILGRLGEHYATNPAMMNVLKNAVIKTNLTEIIKQQLDSLWEKNDPASYLFYLRLLSSKEQFVILSLAPQSDTRKTNDARFITLLKNECSETITKLLRLFQSLDEEDINKFFNDHSFISTIEQSAFNATQHPYNGLVKLLCQCSKETAQKNFTYALFTQIIEVENPPLQELKTLFLKLDKAYVNIFFANELSYQSTLAMLFFKPGKTCPTLLFCETLPDNLYLDVINEILSRNPTSEQDKLIFASLKRQADNKNKETAFFILQRLLPGFSPVYENPATDHIIVFNTLLANLDETQKENLFDSSNIANNFSEYLTYLPNEQVDKKKHEAILHYFKLLPNSQRKKQIQEAFNRDDIKQHAIIIAKVLRASPEKDIVNFLQKPIAQNDAFFSVLSQSEQGLRQCGLLLAKLSEENKNKLLNNNFSALLENLNIQLNQKPLVVTDFCNSLPRAFITKLLSKMAPQQKVSQAYLSFYQQLLTALLKVDTIKLHQEYTQKNIFTHEKISFQKWMEPVKQQATTQLLTELQRCPKDSNRNLLLHLIHSLPQFITTYQNWLALVANHYILNKKNIDIVELCENAQKEDLKDVLTFVQNYFTAEEIIQQIYGNDFLTSEIRLHFFKQALCFNEDYHDVAFNHLKNLPLNEQKAIIEKLKSIELARDTYKDKRINTLLTFQYHLVLIEEQKDKLNHRKSNNPLNQTTASSIDKLLTAFNESHQALSFKYINEGDIEENTKNTMLNSLEDKTLNKQACTHRGLKELFVNLALFLAGGLGIIYFPACAINYVKTGGKHFFFHPKTHTECLLDDLTTSTRKFNAPPCA